MRNLKRALSLALASVMLVGMMVVGTSAASFPDVDDKDHVEAIEVLNAVGVMIGDNGNFRPDDNVSRNEMAVIMAKLILGTYEADSYVGSHPFTDVPDWASKYVAACYSAGIIAGRGEGIYDGSSTVTAVEAAAMMLRALGYEDLSLGAKQWDQPVAAKANEINLFDGLSGASNAAMDRNTVAKLALNSLTATMVKTTRTGQDITIPGGTTIISARNYDDRDPISGVDYDGSNDGKLQLCEYLYGKDLKLDDDYDDFGRPAEVWTYDKKDIVKNAKESVASFTADSDADDVYKELKGYFYNTDDAANKINSKDNALVKSVAGKTENGKLVEVYANDNVITNADVVEIDYSVGKITAVSTNKDGDVTYTVGDKVGSVAAGSGKVYADDTKDTVVLAGAVEKDDIVTFARSKDNKIIYIYPTTTFEGAQKSYNTSKGTINVSGKTYDVMYAVTANSTNFPNSEDSYTYYVDQYGYVVKSEAIESSKDYAVIDGIVLKEDTEDGIKTGVKTVKAVLAFADGTSSTVEVSEIDGIEAKNITKLTATSTAVITTDASGKATALSLNEDGQYNTAFKGAIVTYSKDGSKYELTLKNVTGGLSGAAITLTNSNNTVSANHVVITKGTPTVSYESGTATATNNTQFVVKTEADKFKAYTGFREMPSLTAKGSSTLVSVVLDDGKADLVYIDVSGNNAGFDEGESGRIMYVTSDNYDTYNDDGTYYVIKGIVDGEETTVKTKSTSERTNLTTKGSLLKLTENGDGYVTSTVDATTDKYAKVVLTDGANSTDKTIAGYVYDDPTVYVINSDNELTEDGIENADAGDTIYVKVKGTKGGSDRDDKTIEIIYVIKAGADEGTAPGSINNDQLDKLFNEQGKDKVTVEGDLTGTVTVPEGKTLVLTNATNSGTITLEEGSTLELGEDVTAIPTLDASSKGTIEIKGNVSANAGGNLAGTLKNVADELGDCVKENQSAAKPANDDAVGGKNNPISLTRSKVVLTGDGKLAQYDSVSTINDYIALGKNTTSVTAVFIELEGLDTATVSKIHGFCSADGKDYTKMGGNLGSVAGVTPSEDGSGESGNSAESILLLVGNTTQYLKFTMTKSDTSTYDLYFKIV